MIPFVLAMVSESDMASIRTLLDGFTRIVSMICYGVLLYFLGYSAPTIRPSKLFDAFVWLGDRSYSVYLFHFPVMTLCWLLVDKFYEKAFYAPFYVYGLIQAIFVIIITFTISDFCFRKVELPFNKIGGRIATELPLIGV